MESQPPKWKPTCKNSTSRSKRQVKTATFSVLGTNSMYRTINKSTTHGIEFSMKYSSKNFSAIISSENEPHSVCRNSVLIALHWFLLSRLPWKERQVKRQHTKCRGYDRRLGRSQISHQCWPRIFLNLVNINKTRFFLKSLHARQAPSITTRMPTNRTPKVGRELSEKTQFSQAENLLKVLFWYPSSLLTTTLHNYIYHDGAP